MGISVQCEPSREVAQRGERMAEIMKPKLRQARSIQHPMEHMEHAVWCDRPAGGAGKYIAAAGMLLPLLLQNAYRIRPEAVPREMVR